MFRRISLLSIGFIITGLFLSISGCKQPTTGIESTKPPPSIPANLPLLDKESHDYTETAYFALG